MSREKEMLLEKRAVFEQTLRSLESKYKKQKLSLAKLFKKKKPRLLREDIALFREKLQRTDAELQGLEQQHSQKV